MNKRNKEGTKDIDKWMKESTKERINRIYKEEKMVDRLND